MKKNSMKTKSDKNYKINQYKKDDDYEKIINTFLINKIIALGSMNYLDKEFDLFKQKEKQVNYSSNSSKKIKQIYDSKYEHYSIYGSNEKTEICKVKSVKNGYQKSLFVKK